MPGTLTAGEALCRMFWTNYRLRILGHDQGYKLMTRHPHVSGSLIGQPNTAKHLLSGRIGPGVPRLGRCFFGQFQ